MFLSECCINENNLILEIYELDFSKKGKYEIRKYTCKTCRREFMEKPEKKSVG